MVSCLWIISNDVKCRNVKGGYENSNRDTMNQVEKLGCTR